MQIQDQIHYACCEVVLKRSTYKMEVYLLTLKLQFVIFMWTLRCSQGVAILRINDSRQMAPTRPSSILGYNLVWSSSGLSAITA